MHETSRAVWSPAVAGLLVLLVGNVGCYEHSGRGLAELADSGAQAEHDAGAPDAEPIANTTVAPSGARLTTSETVMTSGRFQLVGSIAASPSGPNTTSATHTLINGVRSALR